MHVEPLLTDVFFHMTSEFLLKIDDLLALPFLDSVWNALIDLFHGFSDLPLQPPEILYFFTGMQIKDSAFNMFVQYLLNNLQFFYKDFSIPQDSLFLDLIKITFQASAKPR
jgi:hypothetical protein